MSEFDNLIKRRAVALKYDSRNNRAPIIVASGMGYLAERITEAAAEAGVPVYEDDSLAVLLSQMKLGSAIPEELYQAVVEIYLYFWIINRRRGYENTADRNGSGHMFSDAGNVVRGRGGSQAHPYCQRESEFQTGTGRASAFNRDWDPEPEGRGNKCFGQQQ